MRTEMDYLVLGPFLLAKGEQPLWQESENWRATFALD
jgi:carbamoyltransferase